MDSLECRTATATQAEPGGLPYALDAAGVVLECVAKPAAVKIWSFRQLCGSAVGFLARLVGARWKAHARSNLPKLIVSMSNGEC
jgi:hypothetical protein